VRDVVRRAAAAAPSGAVVTLQLHPSDAAALTDAHADLSTAVGRAVEVRADASVPAGSARAAHGATRVDASLAAAVARVREVLAP
jgi:flagellar assembly protein FliH